MAANEDSFFFFLMFSPSFNGKVLKGIVLYDCPYFLILSRALKQMYRGFGNQEVQPEHTGQLHAVALRFCCLLFSGHPYLSNVGSFKGLLLGRHGKSRSGLERTSGSLMENQRSALLFPLETPILACSSTFLGVGSHTVWCANMKTNLAPDGSQQLLWVAVATGRVPLFDRPKVDLNP